MVSINQIGRQVFSNVKSELNSIKKKAPEYITGKDFDRLVNDMKVPVVIYVNTSWCTNCAAFKNDFLKGYKNYQNKINFHQMDLDKLENDQVAQKYKITGVPALLVFNKGKLLSTSIGKMDSKLFHQTLKDISENKEIKNKFNNSKDSCIIIKFTPSTEVIEFESLDSKEQSK